MILKYSDIKIVRERMILTQDNLCKLCNHELDSPCLDHDHKTGLVRGVLCRGCNAFLGKIENSLAINKITGNKLRIILSNIVEYRHDENATNMIHPLHNRKKRKKSKKDK